MNNIGLIFACPHGAERPGCPWSKLRQMPTEERYRCYREMSPSEMHELSMAHCVCTQKREIPGAEENP